MKNFYFILILFTGIGSCKNLEKKRPGPGSNEKARMIDADRAFSRMSEEKGMKNAFMEYIDSNGVLLRPNQMPITGADAIDFLSQLNDSSYKLTWEPKNGTVAQSGDLGYTYGVYELRPAGKDTILNGTYVSIWKRQADGSWKFVLDSGNEGIGDGK